VYTIPIIDIYVEIVYYHIMSPIVQNVELFHLLFLDQLGRKLDKDLYSLKGGCNLRFFLKSPRYSEDMDLDIQTIAVKTLQNKVDRILRSLPFKQILQTHKIQIEETSKPKQTETVQRWKLGLRVSGGSTLVRTKIEFSRRGISDARKMEAIDPNIVERHHINPFFCMHYPPEVAFRQKVEALVGRNETQARDVFDLDLLIRSGADTSLVSEDLKRSAFQGGEAALSISFDDFQGHVIAFLPPELQTQYNSKEFWDEMVLRVVEALQ